MYAEKQPLPVGHVVVIEGEARSSTFLKSIGTFTSTVLFVACIFLLGQRVTELRHNVLQSPTAGFRHTRPGDGQSLVDFGLGIDLTVDYGLVVLESHKRSERILIDVHGNLARSPSAMAGTIHKVWRKWMVLNSTRL